MSVANSAKKRVLIVGGGVAGIAGAVALSDAGFLVELVEKRAELGGRAGSFRDHQTGELVDECQHGTMRCCTNLASLLERLGVHHQIDYHDAIHFLDRDGKRSVIKGCGLPAPAHTSLSFLLFRSLSVADKVAIGRAMMAMLRSNPSASWESLSVADWFKKMGQTPRAIARFWEPILFSACNESLDRISCLHAFKIFRDGFLLHPTAFHFGVPKVPLAELYSAPAQKLIEKAGGSVRLKTTVDRFEISEGRVSGVLLNSGERLEADFYVSALQSDLLLKTLPDDAVSSVPGLAKLREIELSPIVGVHLWLDRPVDCPPALALLDRETDWIFNKTLNFGLDPTRGTYLSMVTSADPVLSALPKEQIIEKVWREVRECLPSARDAQILKSYCIRWPKATFAPVPGFESLRPKQDQPLLGIYIAGEWTDTGWPSTMESAARSGYLVAEAICRATRDPRKFLAPDLPVTGLARLLSS